MNVEVAVPSILDRPLTYLWPFDISPKVGQLVEVPLKNSVTMGVIWSLTSNPVNSTHILKKILNYYPLVLPNHFIGFLKKFAEYTLTPLGVLIKHVLPKEISPPIITSAEYVFNVPELTHEQCIAKDAIVNKLGEFHISLLDGVTGSGKTEIYLEASVKAYESGKQTLILLPEIALTAQFRQRFEERFGKKPLIWHSQITPKQRNSIWHQAHQGAPCIMLGARSALLLPFSNLGLLVIDEEHDPSYKQDEVIIYHARDMAILRAKEEGVHAVLVSATPSLETIYNVKQRKFSHLKVNSRFGNASLPTVNILSMRGLKKTQRPSQWLHPTLFEEIQKRIINQEQSLLFLNRRGYAPLTICSDCGFKITCAACDVALVQHKNQPRLHCHYCDFTQPIPEVC
jgi:primosomal protein N' (replication factor Y)